MISQEKIIDKMAKQGRPKKRKPRSSKIKYKVGDEVIVNIFGNIRRGVVESLTGLDGVKLYNIKVGKTKYFPH